MGLYQLAFVELRYMPVKEKWHKFVIKVQPSWDFFFFLNVLSLTAA